MQAKKTVFGPNTAYPDKSGMKISKRTHYRQQGVAWQDNSNPRTRLTMSLEGKLGPDQRWLKPLNFP
jgi:hypothetical protein